MLGSLAQLGEHLPYKQGVTGSSPVGPTDIFYIYRRYSDFYKGSFLMNSIYAGVAELADAQDLKSCCSNTVPVRFRSPA